MRSIRPVLLGVVALLATVLLAVPPLQAQDADGLNLRWGLSVGAVSSTFQGDTRAFEESFCPAEFCTLIGLPSATFSGRQVGLRVGASLETTVTDWLTTRTELNYVQTGGTVRRVARGYREVAAYRINYLTIPLLAQVDLPWQTESFRPSLFAGPALGVRLDWRSKNTIEFEGGSESFSGDVSQGPIGIDQVPRAVLSAVAGSELAYDLPSGRTVALEVRYRRGLTDAVVREEVLLERSAARTEAVSVGLRYVFAP